MKKLLTLLSTIILLFTLAACTNGSGSDKPVVITTLFPQYDMTRAIAGDLVNVEYLLPPGTSAHSYEPSPQRVIRILNADLLIYTGDLMEPWVNALIRSSANEGLKILDLSRNIALLEVEHDPHDDHEGEIGEVDEEDPHRVEESMDTFELLNRRQENVRLAYVHGDHWHGALPNIGVGKSLSLTANIVSEDGNERILDSEGLVNGLKVRLLEGAPSGVVDLENYGNYVEIRGQNPGITRVVFEWTHDGVVRFTTPPIFITITEEDLEDGHGMVDPHFWMDPINAKQMVRDVRNALIELLPEDEDTLRHNARAYLDELDRLHEAFLSMRENAELDVVMHGGHNAFSYFAKRYELEYINPYRGFSTDAEPTPQALGEMIDKMRERNITHLFSEVLIAPNVASAISEETNAEILYLYAGENAPIDEFRDGITFIDMLEHNLRQFKIGLRYDGSGE